MILPRSLATAGLAAVLCATDFGAGAAGGAELAPHRAAYKMTLGGAASGSGISGASGAMLVEWGDSCDGWTIEQRYRLKINHAEGPDSEIGISFVTWEAKDGLSYRFNVRKLRDGETSETLKGMARLDGRGKAGRAEFSQPEPIEIDLPAGTMFPTAHTLALIEAAMSGRKFLAVPVFDGGEFEGALQVSGVIGRRIEPDRASKEALLKGPSWMMRMGFYKPDSSAPEPDYEVGMRVFENGVTSLIVLDYGNFKVNGTLDKVEALPKPSC
jgi:hypothetical protein